jgi:succinate dehydrogenase / fumarate reductase flavoprotein subunit
MPMSDSPTTERHAYDVLVVGAGGAGLRAAIAAHDAGAHVAIVCKSLLGKAHTVMAEGGAAAAMGNLYPEDNWRVHFRDTMRGGKMLNHWRMAQLHAQEAPDRIHELEEWGALFDRTPDGLISQRDFGGHRYARLAHVGDRTGLELIRTLQQRAVALGIDVYMECTVTRLLQDGGRIAGAFAYWRESGRFVLFESPTVILATGGIGKSYKVTSNSWEYTGDGHALALEAGASLVNMEFVQFHPTGMVWPPSVRGILVTESVRGDGGVLRNSEGRRFMFDYIPEFFKAETADSEQEADRWYDDKKTNRRPPELLPRDEVARAINTEVKSGRGSPHGGVFLDIASRRTPDYIQRRLPSMYHQFKELADVDITAEAMEVGPTCHYVMGGVAVAPDTGESSVPGLYAAGEVAGGMHGANRLGGNSLSDLLVFGRRAGLNAAYAVDRLRTPPPTRPWHPLPRRGARTPTQCSTTSKRSCTTWSASSARPTRWSRRSRRSPACANERGRSASRAIASTTPGGTWRSTCTACSVSRSASLARPSNAPRVGAATPATTFRPPTTCGERSTCIAACTARRCRSTASRSRSCPTTCARCSRRSRWATT